MKRAAYIFAILILSLSACSLRTGLDTQMDNLLTEMEDNLSYINTHSDEEVSRMASWFMRHGSDSQKARALYCLGRNQYNSKRYAAAIVSYTMALEYATDTLLNARICYDMAQTSASSLNISDQILYLGRAAEEFHSIGYESEAQKCYLELGRCEIDKGDLGTAERIFISVLGEAHELKDTLLEAHCLEAYASLAVQKDTADPVLAIDLLDRAANQLRYRLSSPDKGILAYSYSLIGNIPEAFRWLSDAKASAETPAQEADAAFREYQVASRAGDSARALAALEKVVSYGNSAQTEALGETVASSQREYIQSQADAQSEKLRSARLRLWLISLAALLAIGAILFASYLHRNEEKRRLEAQTAEKEQYMSIAEDLRKQLSATEGTHASPKIPWNVDALERICEQYYIYEGTENLQPKIMKEVKSIVNGLRSDPKIQKSLENLLNENYDGLMEKLREEFPAWKNEDYLLYIFTASGFSTTTISTLLGKDKKAIYNKVWRLKNRISTSTAPHRDLFIAHLR